jgi:hypothetical protein
MAMNSHRLPGKGRRMRPIMGHKMYYRRIIITIKSGHYIPPLKKKKRFKSIYLIVWWYIYTKFLPRAHTRES